MKIILDLSKHCIETEIKRFYNQSVSKYFKPNPDKAGLEREIEILREVLETFDFKRLRNTYPPFGGHHNDYVVLGVNDQNKIILFLNGKSIEPI